MCDMVCGMMTEHSPLYSCKNNRKSTSIFCNYDKMQNLYLPITTENSTLMFATMTEHSVYLLSFAKMTEHSTLFFPNNYRTK